MNQKTFVVEQTEAIVRERNVPAAAGHAWTRARVLASARRDSGGGPGGALVIVSWQSVVAQRPVNAKMS